VLGVTSGSCWVRLFENLAFSFMREIMMFFYIFGSLKWIKWA
jgi:hypothetical protein